VSEHGAAGLTIDGVAKAAGITKGGVQSCFGNKESLIEAMLVRWGARYDQQVAQLKGDSENPVDALRAHLETTNSDTGNSTSRSAVLLSSLLQSPDYLGWIKDWYTQRHQEFMSGPEETDEARRVAFLATEGLFFLRHFRLMELSPAEWERNAAAIKRLLDSSE